MIKTELLQQHQSGMDIDTIINSRANALTQVNQTDQHSIPRPITQDDEVTIEDEYQMAFWRSQINPMQSENRLSRGFYARFDREAQARAIGKLPQTFIFDGPMPTQTEGLSEMITRFENKTKINVTEKETPIYES